MLTSFGNEYQIFGHVLPRRFDDETLKITKKHKKCVLWFYTNFGVLYVSIPFIYTNIPAAAVLLVQKQYTEEIITCLNQKCWCGGYSNMQKIHMHKKDKFVNTDIYTWNTLVTCQL